MVPSAFAPHRGGVEELTLKLGQHLQRAGAEILVITNRHPPGLARGEQVDGLQVRRLSFTAPGRRPDRILRHVMAQASIDKELTALGPVPDVAHVVCASVQLPRVARWANRRGVPLVITSAGETVMDNGRLYQRSAWMRRELRQAAAGASAMTACSAWTVRETARIAPAFAAATVIYNGVDLDDWQMQAPSASSPVVAAWGRHVPQKGFDLLLDAWPRVTAEIPAARLLLGGSGPETGRLRGAVAGPGSVEFLGPLDRAGVRDLLERSSVAVVPSRIEPFGIVAVEALAAGRGLVYAAGTGLSEAAGGCGRSVDVHDSGALAAGIIAELRDPTPAVRGRARAAALSWDRLVDDYRLIYDRLSTSR